MRRCNACTSAAVPPLCAQLAAACSRIRIRMCICGSKKEARNSKRGCCGARARLLQRPAAGPPHPPHTRGPQRRRGNKMHHHGLRVRAIVMLTLHDGLHRPLSCRSRVRHLCCTDKQKLSVLVDHASCVEAPPAVSHAGAAALTPPPRSPPRPSTARCSPWR